MNSHLEKFLKKCQIKLPATDEEVDEIKKYLKSELPESYIQLLKFTNGFSGEVEGGGFFQIWKSEEVIKLNDLYHTSKFIPGMLLIGSDGGDESIGIDLRKDSQTFGHYFTTPFLPLDWDNSIHLGSLFDDINNYSSKLINSNDKIIIEGFVRIPVDTNTLVEEKIIQAMQKQLNKIYDPTKHQYQYEPRKMLGSALYCIYRIHS